MSDLGFRLCRRTFAVCLKEIAESLPRPVGKPSRKPLVEYKAFLYEAARWKTTRRVGTEGGESCGGAVPAGGLHRDLVAYLAGLP
jgi:hypothetical protein